jgi:hypothetical protein
MTELQMRSAEYETSTPNIATYFLRFYCTEYTDITEQNNFYMRDIQVMLC